jgi:hypothetical protein
MGRRLGLGVLIAGAAAAVVLGGPFFSVLEVIDTRRGTALFCRRMARGEEFAISFTHSVNRRPVYDTLRAEGDHLVIVGSRFDAFGAGMPEGSTDDGVLTVGRDGWLEWRVNRAVEELTLRVGRVAGHVLHLGRREIHLAELIEPGSALTLRARSVRMLDLLMKGRCAP